MQKNYRAVFRIGCKYEDSLFAFSIKELDLCIYTALIRGNSIIYRYLTILFSRSEIQHI